MYTQCPSCASIFRLAPVHLREAGGQVHCGLCNEPFDALETLSAQVPGMIPPTGQSRAPTSPPAETPASAASPAEQYAATGKAEPHRPAPAIGQAQPADSPSLHAEAAAPRPGPGETAEPRARPATSPGGLDLPEHDPEAELEMPASAPARRRAPLLWGLAGLVLIAALLVSGAYFGRAELMHYPQLRPALQALCGTLGCELPLPREPRNIEVVQSEVSVHPRIGGLLQVRAVLRNPMGYPVDYPRLRLRFTDLNGREIAQRSFRPAQYLAGRDEVRALGLMPGESLVLELEAPDPGERAAAFELLLE